MATQDLLHCSVITPDQQILEADATAVVFPAHDGLIGILKDRAPLLCELGTGILRVDTTDDGSRQFMVDGGFAQVLHNQVTILTDRASDAASVTRSAAQDALAKAQAMPAGDEGASAARERAIRRATAQIDIATK